MDKAHTLFLCLNLCVEPGHLQLKIGTCQHCVVEEVGRPASSWDAQDDQDLNFDRDALLAQLQELGIVLENRTAYICP